MKKKWIGLAILIVAGLWLMGRSPTLAPSPAEERSAPTESSESECPIPETLPRPVGRAATGPVVVKDTLPTKLPESPELLAELAQAGPDSREIYDYLLGAMAYYATCMGEKIPRGSIDYYLNWDVPADGMASIGDEDGVEIDPNNPPAGADKEAVDAFVACLHEYTAAHPTVDLPSLREEGQRLSWGLHATFPVREAPIYAMIAAQ